MLQWNWLLSSGLILSKPVLPQGFCTSCSLCLGHPLVFLWPAPPPHHVVLISDDTSLQWPFPGCFTSSTFFRPCVCHLSILMLITSWSDQLLITLCTLYVPTSCAGPREAGPSWSCSTQQPQCLKQLVTLEITNICWMDCLLYKTLVFVKYF